MNHIEAKKILNNTYGVVSLLSERDANPKIVKSDKSLKGYFSRIMHFAPAKLSGYEVCPARTPQCTKACLHTAGCKMHQGGKNKARIGRTKFFFEHREAFKALLFYEVELWVKYCKKHGVKPAIRLNGTSDIVWEKVFPDLFTKFPNVRFYDYSKIVQRFSPNWKLPKNYYLTFSRAETKESNRNTVKILERGKNVSVVFGNCGYGRWRKPLPTNYLGYKVIDGDVHDLRFIDKQGVVVGIRAKGKAYRSKSHFVVRLPVLLNR